MGQIVQAGRRLTTGWSAQGRIYIVRRSRPVTIRRSRLIPRLFKVNNIFVYNNATVVMET